jgi:hypothetical protein
LRINPVTLVRCRSAVKHSDRRTGSGSRSGRAATQCALLPTSTLLHADGPPLSLDPLIAIAAPIPSILPVPPQLLVRRHLCSPVRDEIRFDPLSIGLRNLSNGVKESSHRRPLPPCERSPVPEPCFYPGTKQQRESALACRPESRSDLQQPGAVDERLAQVTVSKARSAAFIGHLAWLDWLDLAQYALLTPSSIGPRIKSQLFVTEYSLQRLSSHST